MRRFSTVLGDAPTERKDAAPGGPPLVPTVPTEPPPGRSGRPWPQASAPVRGISELAESRTVGPKVEKNEPEEAREVPATSEPAESRTAEQEVVSNDAVLAEAFELLSDAARRAAAAGRQLTLASLLDEARSGQGGSSADAAWEPFAALLRADAAAPAEAAGYDKFTMPAKYFLFGETDAFMNGLPGMLKGGLSRSMAEEAWFNEGGRWWEEFRYVVERRAEEDVADLPSTAKFKGKTSSSGHVIVRDHGHSGMTLSSFCEHAMAKAAQLSPAEVAALRLYSGPMFAPMNYALRTEQIADWATTIGCCYSGVLKLSFQSQPARVYRGVQETDLQLPAEFLRCSEGKFAGGVERAFMSTTKSAAVALDYSGGGATPGSIFVIDFGMSSRGASIQWVSQYPHEEELLFPPCTGLASLGFSQHGVKRCIRVEAQVSTARLDTREVATAYWVPGMAATMPWFAEQLCVGVDEVATLESWNLDNKPLGGSNVRTLSL